MVRLTASYFALATLLATTPALADETVLIADASSSKSRAAVRHDTSEETAVKSTNARSKSRRATRHENASEAVAATQNRGKRSRRNPGADTLAAPMVASTDANDAGILSLAANRDALGQHGQAADFKGETGALALYHLIGKAVADQPLNDTETQALAVALDGTDFASLIADTEARLIEAAADSATLDQIADALGIPRPAVTPGVTPNLGAALVIGADIPKG
ncbi:MAG: hypothetical protein ACU0GG_11535 [Paracoccaceae bacterium]